MGKSKINIPVFPGPRDLLFLNTPMKNAVNCFTLAPLASSAFLATRTPG
jgi:hypothetical protein